MDNFKKRFYSFLKNEIDRYEDGESTKEPFLYTYLKRKKEENPRIVILKSYLEFLQNGCLTPQTVVMAAEALLKRTGLASSASTSIDLCQALLKDVQENFPYNEKRKDRYVQLREQELMFRCEKEHDKWKYFKYLLDFVLAYTMPVSIKTFSLFESVWERIRCAAPDTPATEIPLGGKKYDRFRKRLESLRVSVDAFEFTDTLSDTIPLQTLYDLTEQMLQTVIKTDAAAWLYDAGYPVIVERKGERIPVRPRKIDHTMELIDEFYRERGKAFDSRPNTEFSLTESENDINRLFELLDKDKKRAKVVVPITIDAATGAGLYIVGTECFRNCSRKFRAYKEEHSCCYNVIIPTEYRDFGGSGIFYQMDDNEELQIYESGRLDEAYTYFSAIIDLASEEEGYAYFLYQDINSDPPEGCPEAYLKYFIEEDLPFDSAEQEEIPKIQPGKRIASSSREI